MLAGATQGLFIIHPLEHTNVQMYISRQNTRLSNSKLYRGYLLFTPSYMQTYKCKVPAKTRGCEIQSYTGGIYPPPPSYIQTYKCKVPVKTRGCQIQSYAGGIYYSPPRTYKRTNVKFPPKHAAVKFKDASTVMDPMLRLRPHHVREIRKRCFISMVWPTVKTNPSRKRMKRYVNAGFAFSCGRKTF